MRRLMEILVVWRRIIRSLNKNVETVKGMTAGLKSMCPINTRRKTRRIEHKTPDW